MKKKYLFVLLVLCFAGEITFADSGWVEWDDHPDATIHQYKRIDTLMTWNDAKIYAESLGGYLATVTSEPENTFLWNTFVQDISQATMLGGFQPPGTPEPDTGWQWVTGEEWNYTNWATGQPDDAHGGQDYLTFYYDKTWDDNYVNIRPYPSIVEIPEPATVLLLGLGGLVVLRKRKM